MDSDHRNDGNVRWKKRIPAADLRAAGLFLGLLLLDQWTKALAAARLAGAGAVALIPGVLELRYLENRGAAFGMMRNRQWIFIGTAVLICGICLWGYLRLRKRGKRYLPLQLVCVLLSCGGAGNLADRLARGYVVDFIYIRLIDFPIFNAADVYVTVGCAALLLLLIFRYRDEELSELFSLGKRRGS